MWPSLWSQTLSHARTSHPKSNACPSSPNHPSIPNLVLHKKHSCRPRPAPRHFGRGRDIQSVDDPEPLRLRPPPVPQQVFADSEQCCSNACELWSDNISACWVLLGVCVWMWIGKQRSSLGHWGFLLGQCGDFGGLC